MAEENKDESKDGDKDKGDKVDYAKENETLKAKLAEYEKQKSENDKSLNDRLKAQAQSKEEVQALETAINFNLTSGQFLKDNESVLPKEIGDLFKLADKEKYDTPVQKANATKASVIEKFFELQANVNLLTPGHKLALEQYLKLTKNGKEEKAQYVYENIFEPALNRLRDQKKAEEVQKSKNGLGDGTDKAYKEKLMNLGRKHYLGEKQ